MKLFPPDGHPYFKPPYAKPDRENAFVIALVCYITPAIAVLALIVMSMPR